MMKMPFLVHFEVVRRRGGMVGQVERILRRRNVRALPISLLMTASVLAVAFMMVSTVWGEPVPRTRAIGNATLIWEGIEGPVTVKFKVYQVTPEDYGDSGAFSFSREDGQYFEIDVVHMKVHFETLAVFTGPVTDADYPEMAPGLWIVVWAADNDDPGSRIDRMRYEVMKGEEEAIERANCPDSVNSLGVVLNGNIKVFSAISEVPDG